jgi:hypothetical protein
LNAVLQKEGAKVTVNALHPGVIATNLSRHLPGGIASAISNPPKADAKTAAATDSKKDSKAPAAPVFVPRIKTVGQGAATTLTVAVLPQYATEGGLYLSDCNPVKPLPYAEDMAAAEKLWKLTEENIAAASK